MAEIANKNNTKSCKDKAMIFPDNISILDIYVSQYCESIYSSNEM